MSLVSHFIVVCFVVKDFLQSWALGGVGLTVPMLCSHLRASASASAAFPYEGRTSRCFGSFGFSSRDLLYAGQGFVISKRQVVCKHKAETIIGFVLLFQCDHWICVAFHVSLWFRACLFRHAYSGHVPQGRTKPRPSLALSCFNIVIVGFASLCSFIFVVQVLPIQACIFRTCGAASRDANQMLCL